MKTFVLIAVAASLGVLPALVTSNPGQTSRPARSSARSAEAQSKAEAAAKAEAMTKAKKLYQMDCALCHGDAGDGKTDVAKEMNLVMPDWTDPKTLATMSDQDLFKIIRNGKDKMPAEGVGRAKDDEINDVIAYIRTLAKAGAAAAPAEMPAPAAEAPKTPEAPKN